MVFAHFQKAVVRFRGTYAKKEIEVFLNSESLEKIELMYTVHTQ